MAVVARTKRVPRPTSAYKAMEPQVTKNTILSAGDLALALGANTFGWTSDEETSFEVLDAFRDAGGKMIDTADNYSIWAEGNQGGESERIIGDWLASRRSRHEVILGTKVSRHPDFPGLGRASILGGVEASLRRLQTDYIDIYYAHYDDPKTPVEESANAFRDLQLTGKIRHVGLSNFSPERLEEWTAFTDGQGWPGPAVLQPHYNLVHRQPYERELAPLVRKLGIEVVPYFALASGFLSGKYRTAADIARSSRSRFTGQYMSPPAVAVLELLDSISDQTGASMPTIALAWLLGQDGVVAPIASARTADQVDALVASATFHLEAEARFLLDEASALIHDDSLNSE